MFERILLPLDGSQSAEAAIPYAEELASRLGSEVTLLHISTPQRQPFHRMHELYLEGITNTVRRNLKKKLTGGKECQVRAEALNGEPAELVCDYIEKNNIGLAVLPTGAPGLKMRMLDGVVDKVIRAVNIPALLIRAKESPPAKSKRRLISRILLPLDGSDTSKMVIPYAVELAKRLKASITLFRMARMNYAYTTMEGMTYANIDWVRMDAAEEKRIRTYLADVGEELKEENIRVTNVVTLGTDPAAEILEQEKKTKADLVIMATRGRSPIVRWVFGSTAEKVLREGDLPLLLVRKASD